MLQFCDRIDGDLCFLRLINKSKDLDIWSSWFNDKDVLRYSIHRTSKTTPEKQLAVLKKINECDKKFQFMICMTPDSPVGVISIIFDEFFSSGSISIIIGEKSQWGKGIATDAINSLTKEIKSINCGIKLRAGCDSRNIGSRKAFEKAGFRLTKTVLKNIKYDDDPRFYDLDLMEL